MIVRNLIAECDDGRHRGYKGGRASTQAWHRISFAGDDGGKHRGVVAFPDVSEIPDEQLTGLGVALRFRDVRRAPPGSPDWVRRPGSYTGGQVPYSVLIRTDGSVDQMLAFSDVGPHAQRWSSLAIGIAVAGDFTKHAPTVEQTDTAAALAALLLSHELGLPQGHTELDGASSDPNKQCPGHLFGMDTLRHMAQTHDLATLSKDQAAAVLTELGFVL